MNNLKIERSYLQKFVLYLFLLFPFFSPAYFSFITSKAGYLFTIWQLGAGVIALILIINVRKYSRIINYIVIYLGILFVSTYLNQADMSSCITSIIQILSLSLVVDYGIRNNTKVFLHAFKTILSVLVLINFITILLYPTGMMIGGDYYYQIWFLGYKNSHILYILPAIMASFTYSYYTRNKLVVADYLLLLIALISTFLVSNSTGLVGISIIIIFTLFRFIFKNKLFNILNYFIIYIASFFGIIIFRVQEWFSFIIVDILNRDITFTGRIYIWDYVIDFIKKKQLLGYGLENSIVRYNKTTYWQSYHAHNQFLEVVYKTGFIGLIFFLLMMYEGCKKLWINRRENVSKFLSIFLFTYFIMMITEAYSLEYILFIFVLTSNVDKLVKGGEIKNAKN